MVQLVLTVLIALPFQFESVIPRAWVLKHIWLMYTCMFASLAVICCISFCANAGRKFPTNYCLLFGFTVLEAVTIGFVTAFYTAEAVLLALATTAIVFGALTAYACCTKSDFTGWGPYLYCALSALVCFSFMVLMFGLIFGFARLRALHLILAFGGAILFSFFIVYDTQMIVGGKHKKYQFEVDEYVFAALNLYLDIINLFLYLLSILGNRD